MLKECKLAMRITTNAADGDLALKLDAAAKDLTTAGVVLPGTVSFTTTNDGIQDNSTLTDALVMQALITYVRMMFASPDDYERLREAYRSQKINFMHANSYTNYNGGSTTDGQS